MTRRYTGGLISATAQTTDANSANGIFTLADAQERTARGDFPVGRWTPQRSLRFRAAASAYLNRTKLTPTNNLKWTWSAWVKRGTLGASNILFTAGDGSSNNFAGLQIRSDDTLQFAQVNGGTYNVQVYTTAVFRDPSAWYHIVVVYDSANAISTDRVQFYVNGVRYTSLTYATGPFAQNTASKINSAIAHYTGKLDYTGIYFDGHITENNFIDGQALTPTSFGSTDAETGTWVPKRYAGTYGSNGFYLPFNDNTSATTLGYDFSAGTYSQNLRSLGTNIGTLTLNGGLASAFDGNTNQANAASARVSSPAAGYNTAVIGKDWGVGASKTITAVRLFAQNDGGFVGGTTNALTFKLQGSNDNSSWTDLTSEITGPATGAGTVITVTSGITTTAAYRYHRINMNANGADNYYMCELEFYEAGIYGFNNWTVNNFSITAGTTYDSMVDVPGVASVSSQADIGGIARGNYCTLNPLDIGGSGITLSNGNLSYTNSGGQLRGTIGTDTSSKWYWEFTNGTTAGPYTPVIFGISTLDGPITNNSTVLRLAAYIYTDGGANWTASFYINGTNVSYITTQFRSAAVGDIFQVAYDAATGKLWFGKNNTWYDGVNSTTGSPSTGANPVYTLPVGSPMTPSIANVGATYSGTLNCGQRPFSYTPPTGFKSLNTTNLPNPIIKRPVEHFDVKTWTGNGSNITIGTTAKQTSAVQFNKSLRFRRDASAYLSRTPASAGNRKTWTWSGWVKRGLAGSETHEIFSGDNGETSFTGIRILNNQIYVQDFLSATKNIFWITNAVFRNASSGWDHVVVKYDTTQASSTNSVLVYVNGVSQSLSLTQATGTYVQNYDGIVNSTNNHKIGSKANQHYFDGYIAEVNFIDGQALTPASFGQFDANNNWFPKTYTGTYGTNGFRLDFSDTRSPATIANDVSGNSNHYTANNIVSVPEASNAPNVLYYGNTGTYTWTAPAGVTSVNYLVVAGGAGGGTSANDSRGGGGGAGGMLTGTLSVTPLTSYTVTVGAGGGVATNGSNSVFSSITSTGGGAGGGTGAGAAGGSGGGGGQNVSAGGAGTAGQGNAGGSGGYDANGGQCGGGGGGAGAVGAVGTGSVSGVPGGAGLASSITGVSTFYAGGGGAGGQVDGGLGGIGGGGQGGDGRADGARPVAPATRGFINTGGGGGGGGPAAAAASGGSGVVILSYTNANSYVGAGTGSVFQDNVYDTPTDTVDSSGNTIGNYAVLNGNDLGYSAVVSEGNLKVSTASASNAAVSSNFSLTTDTYWEVTVGSNIQVGLIWGRASAAYDGSSLSLFASGATGSLGYATRTLSATPSWSNGETLGFAWNNSARTLTLYQAGSATAVMTMGTPSVGDPKVAITNYTSGAVMSARINFGQAGFVYTPPAGYKTLNTKTLKDVGSYNLPDTFGNFVNTPDLVWIKRRDTTSQHVLSDTVRGPDRELFTPSTIAQQSGTKQFVQGFNPNGFELGASASGTGDVNITGGTYVGWNWNRGRVPGFDIVTYAGTGVAKTIAHNLGVAPQWMIVKSITAAGTNSVVYNSAIPPTKYLLLNTTGVATTDSTPWNNTAPSSSDFSVGTSSNTNGASSSFIAYLWAEVPGFSKFGSYTGNGSADGPFVYTGFKPRFILFKRTDAVADWHMYDTSRDEYNPLSKEMNTSTTIAETTAGGVRFDYLSNGFKVRGSGSALNASGGNYIFMAFAETPFKYANAR